MIDLEREVREVLEQRAEESAGWSSEHMPERVRGRIRRRKARTVALTGLAVALVALGALAGARALMPPAGREPGTGPPTTSPFPMAPNPRMTVFATGQFRGLEWKVSAGRDGETWCVEVEAKTERGGESIGSCERNPLQNRDLVATALNSPGFPAAVVSGFVSAEVDRVVFDFDAGGQIAGRLYAVPGSIKPPFDAFLIVIPEEHPVRGLVMAIDADGNVLARHGIYEPVGPFGLEDAYGNVIGYIPASNPLWHEWAEPGTPATRERIESIRHAATFPLRDVWPEVREWWKSRPQAEAPDDAFLDWWASYPVTELSL